MVSSSFRYQSTTALMECIRVLLYVGIEGGFLAFHYSLFPLPTMIFRPMGYTSYRNGCLKAFWSLGTAHGHCTYWPAKSLPSVWQGAVIAHTA